MMRIILYTGLGVLVGFFTGGFLGVSVFWKISDSAVSMTAFLSSFVLGIIGSFIGRILNKRDAQKQIQNEPGISALPSWASAFLNAYSILIMIIAVFPFAFILGAAVIGVVAGKSMDYSLLSQSFMFLAMIFGAMVLAGGIWNRKKWVVPLLALWFVNSLAMIMWNGIDDVREFIMPSLAAGIFALVYRYRASFSGSFLHYILQGSFLVSLIFSWIVFLNPSLTARKTDAQNQNMSGAAESTEKLRDFFFDRPDGFSLQYPAYFSVDMNVNVIDLFDKFWFGRKDAEGDVVEDISFQIISGALDGIVHPSYNVDAYIFQYSESAKTWEPFPSDPELNKLAPAPYATKNSLRAYVFQTSYSVWQWETAYVEHPAKASVAVITISRNLKANSLMSDRDTIYSILDSVRFKDELTKSGIFAVNLEEHAIRLGILIPSLSQELNEPKYGDFDGDGKDEAAFTVFGGGTGGSYGPYVLKLRDDASVVSLDIEKAVFRDSHGHESFGVFQNKLINYFPLYNENDPNCCPTGGIRYILLKWDKTNPRFVVEKTTDLEYAWYEKIQKSEGQGGWDVALNEAIKRLGLSAGQ